MTWLNYNAKQRRPSKKLSLSLSKRVLKFLALIFKSFPSIECKNYKTLNDKERARSYQGVYKCDSSLVKDWYKFTGSAGNQMADSPVPMKHCGTHAPGYLSGGHPTVAEGAVSRKVCFHWTRGNCQWSTNIRVRNCGAFYVYELSKPPTCHLRYCGESK